MATYYVYNVDYPKAYQPLLFCFQDFIMDKADNGKRPILGMHHLLRHYLLTLSRATALFGTTRDLIEWARALFGTISIWPTLSSHSS